MSHMIAHLKGPAVESQEGDKNVGRRFVGMPQLTEESSLVAHSLNLVNVSEELYLGCDFDSRGAVSMHLDFHELLFWRQFL